MLVLSSHDAVVGERNGRARSDGHDRHGHNGDGVGHGDDRDLVCDGHGRQCAGRAGPGWRGGRLC
jgi:hypothetical protein